MSTDLNPAKALIFRIVHVDCVPWILKHGLHCRNSPDQDPHYVNIGSASLIDKRSRHVVPIRPGGTLSDYVPFYFTPWSMMMLNIHTGYGGITRRTNKDIVIFVSSLRRVHQLNLRFVFTNQHAYAADTDYFDDLANLSQIDWPLLQSRNFKTSDADPGRQLRYQAEALVHRHVPLTALRGIGCHNDVVKQKLESMIDARGLDLTIEVTPSWYFS
ncbi:MAG: DUF4433 domain-containing protein [Verrucomicrobia bacterium]|nr:MAG: DUF4433 domain-containing protein [Verrucomicrobiota bacterium]